VKGEDRNEMDRSWGSRRERPEKEEEEKKMSNKVVM